MSASRLEPAGLGLSIGQITFPLRHGSARGFNRCHSLKIWVFGPFAALAGKMGIAGPCSDYRNLAQLAEIAAECRARFGRKLDEDAPAVAWIGAADEDAFGDQRV